jgi:hypothetical protein
MITIWRKMATATWSGLAVQAKVVLQILYKEQELKKEGGHIGKRPS